MNLLFRKIKDSDLEQIMYWRASPHVTKYMYTDIVPDIKKQADWFRKISADKSRRDWVVCVDGVSVGLVSIYEIDDLNKRCSWAYYIGAKDARGRGIGKNIELNIQRYVFEELGLNKLCSDLFASNEFVIKIHEKYGVKKEGLHRQHVFKNGQFHDVVDMAITRNDWEKFVREKIDYTVGIFEFTG